MSFLDFVAFFLFTIVFSFVFSVYRKKIKRPALRQYHRNAFIIKIFASFCYSLFVLYISLGDSTTLFFPEGYNLYQQILKDPSNLHFLLGSGKELDANMLADPSTLGYFADESNFLIVKVTAIMCFFCFGKYMVVSLFFAMIAFTGIWKLYVFFCDQYPQLYKQFAIAILFLPTFTFWSSGIMKDTLAVSILGWFTYALYELSYHKKSVLKNAFIIIISTYLFSIIKIYILVAYLPAFILFLLLKNAQLLKNRLAKVALVSSFIIASIVGFIGLSDKMQGSVAKYAGEDVTKSISYFQQNYAHQSQLSEGSYFSLGVEFDGSAGSLARMAPAAINATLFRPYIWESNNKSSLLSSFESLALMLFTLFVIWKVGIKYFILTILKRPIVLYCLFFSLVFALFVGATTLNFGTLVRYKIPAMPFYVSAMFLILFYNNKIKGLRKEEKEAMQTAAPAQPSIAL